MPVLTCSLSAFLFNNAFCKPMLCSIQITVIQAYWTLKRNSFCLTCSISIYAYNNGSAGMVCVSAATNQYHSQCSLRVACDVLCRRLFCRSVENCLRTSLLADANLRLRQTGSRNEAVGSACCHMAVTTSQSSVKLCLWHVSSDTLYNNAVSSDSDRRSCR